MILTILLGCISDPPSSDLEKRVSALEASDAQGETDLADLQTRLDAAEGRLDAAEARLDAAEAALAQLSIITLQDCASGGTAPSVVTTLTSDQEIVVGSEAELRVALTCLDAYRIGSDATVTIQMTSDSAIAFAAPIEVHHPDGARIRIEGGSGADSLVTLSFPGSDGLVLENGQDLGFFGGFAMTGPGDGSDYDGIRVDSGASLRIGALAISSFGGDGLEAADGGFIAKDETPTALGWLVVSDCGVGMRTSIGGILDLAYAEVGSSATNGFYAADGSILYAEYSTSTGSVAGYGFQSVSGSVLQGEDSTSSDNEKGGYYAGGGALMYANYSCATGNGVSAYHQFTLGILNATDYSCDKSTSSDLNADDLLIGIGGDF